jgi:hypothetical protein
VQRANFCVHQKGWKQVEKELIFFFGGDISVSTKKDEGCVRSALANAADETKPLLSALNQTSACLGATSCVRSALASR